MVAAANKSMATRCSWINNFARARYFNSESTFVLSDNTRVGRWINQNVFNPLLGYRSTDARLRGFLGNRKTALQSMVQQIQEIPVITEQSPAEQDGYRIELAGLHRQAHIYFKQIYALTEQRTTQDTALNLMGQARNLLTKIETHLNYRA